MISGMLPDKHMKILEYRPLLMRWSLTGVLLGGMIVCLVAQEAILTARHHPSGSVVNVSGIVLNGDELGVIRYMQDSTAGIAVYPGGSSPMSFAEAMAGDRIQVNGVLSLYHGLLEINPILSWQKLSSGNPLPEPADVSPGDTQFDDQAKRVRIHCAQFTDEMDAFVNGDAGFYTPDGKDGMLSIGGNNPLIGSAIPDMPVVMTGIFSWYDGFRLLVRSPDEISTTDCFSILPKPEQQNIQQHGFDLNWITSDASTGLVILNDETGTADTLEMFDHDVLQHSLHLNNLSPATFYAVRTGAVNLSNDTAWYPQVLMSTASESSGMISVYFNQSVDSTFSNGAHPSGVGFQAMLDEILDLIDHATQSVDVAMYNNNRSDIIAALVSAQQRGVRVRYIADGSEPNTALDPLPGFPVLFRNGDGIMHDKFMVIDPEDPQNAEVWTGSTNQTTSQLSWDPNNAIVLQDQAVARVYLHEFEEMWGSHGAQPDLQQSRTGSAKQDDTPHLFNVGDRSVEVYFSPSDGTNTHIRTALESAQSNIDAALLLLTRDDLTAEMLNKKSVGVAVRVIIDDVQSSSVEYQALISGGVPVAHHDFSSIFHHKYAVVDDGLPTAFVMTGSHNWTTSATTINDENMLIVRDPDIANIYRQEFEARWEELVTGTENATPAQPVVYPNPAGDLLYLQADTPGMTCEIYSSTGQLIRQVSETHGVIGISFLEPGLYFLSIEKRNGMRRTVPFVKK